jgi:hypothetical protein
MTMNDISKAKFIGDQILLVNGKYVNGGAKLWPLVVDNHSSFC